MNRDNGIKTTEYRMEWVDHLYDIYGNFGRRNDVNEWVYFFRRPEMAIARERDEIEKQIFHYIARYGNIAQNVVIVIEEAFGYMEKKEKYEELLGFDAVEVYQRYQLGMEEFPPYGLFEDLRQDKDYDGFVDAFRQLYFGSEIEDAESFRQEMDRIKALDIRHPYMALLESRYFRLCGAWQSALDCLQGMDDGYHKHMQMGFVFSAMKAYDMAEECYIKAMDQRERELDPALVTEYMICKWETGRLVEALEAANELSEKGYEYVILPVKQELLHDLAVRLAEESKERELSEAEMLILKEFCMIMGDSESVITLCEIGMERGFERESWVVDLAEAYFETGQHRKAADIVDMVYKGGRKMSATELGKIRELRGRLLFAEGRVADAYEIMGNLCRSRGCPIRRKFILAEMYLTTGRVDSAIELFSALRFDSQHDMVYWYELARCFIKKDESQKAHQLLKAIAEKEPRFLQTAYLLVQTSIECGELERAEKELAEMSEHIPECYAKYLRAQMEEMRERYRKARDIYLEIMNDHVEGNFDEKLIHDVYLRYFVMLEQLGGWVGPVADEIERVLGHIPEAAELWVYYGDLNERTQQKEGKTERCYLNALKADPFNEAAMLKLILLYNESERWEQVWKLSNDLILYTDSGVAYLSRAESGIEMERLDRCLSDLTVYEKKGGEKYQIHNMKGRLAVKKGEYDKAVDEFEKAMKVRSPSDLPCYDDIAVAMCKAGKYEEAAEILDVACENTGNEVYYILLYWIYMHCGEFKKARNVLGRYRKECGFSHFNDRYGYMMAQMLLESGKGFVADRIAESIASFEGEEFCAMSELMKKNYGKAARMFRKLLEKQRDQVDNYSWLAFALYLGGSPGEARDWAERGLKLLKEMYGEEDAAVRPDILCQYGFLHAMAGRGERAVKAFVRALKRPTCSDHICQRCHEAYYGLGVCYAINGQRKQADEAFERSLRIKPYNALCRRVAQMI